MAQQFDYRLQVQDPFASAIRAVQLGTTLQQAETQQKSAILEQQALQQAMQKQQLFQNKIGEISQKGIGNATAQDIFELQLYTDDKKAAALRQGWETLDKSVQQETLKSTSEILSALTAGKPEIAIDRLTQRATALRNSGDPQNIAKAELLEKDAELAKVDPDFLRLDLAYRISGFPGSKDFVESALKMTAEPEAGFRPITAQERKDLAAAGNPLPEGVPFQIGPKGEIKEVTRGPLVTIDQGKRDTLALKELDIPRAKEFSDAAASARKLASDTRVISNILKGAGGGRMVKLTTELARDFGFETDTVAANDLANSLATRGAVQIRAPGSGATSDLEFKSYLQAFPSLANSERGRQVMSKYADAFAKRSARLADHARKLIREDRYTEEEIARFDESLGPLLGEDFYELARPSKRPGVPGYPGQQRAPAANNSIRSRADEIIRGQ
jgi:hypothetical protein